MRIPDPEYIFVILPIEQLHPDVSQPRKDVQNDNERAKLIASIEKYGIETPLSVTKIEEGVYDIIDGHRRYFSARDIGIKKIPCRVYDKMSKGELESRRFEIQNNRKNWRPLERAGALEKIKEFFKFKTNRELSDHLHISETPVANSLQLKREQIEYLEIMAKYELPESYQIEFMRLKPKLRRIREFEVYEIIDRIFQKVDQDTIKTSRDFRRLGSVFLRATANEKELHKFLSDPDETVEELVKRTSRSSFTLAAEELIKDITDRKSQGIAFSPQDEIILRQLAILLKQTLS